MAATSQKQAQIGAIKDISTSMSCSFSQPLFLQKPEMCLYNPTHLYLQEEKQKKIVSVKLSTPHTTSFLRVFDVFGMVRRKFKNYMRLHEIASACANQVLKTECTCYPTAEGRVGKLGM